MHTLSGTRIVTFLFLSYNWRPVKCDPLKLHSPHALVPSCCSYQNQFNKESKYGECADSPSKNLLSFPDSLNLPAYLLSDGYRNRTHLQNIRFGLEKNALTCGQGSFTVTMDMEDKEDLFNSLRSVSLTLDGHLQVENDYFSTNEYCINAVENTRVKFEVCRPSCSEKTPCIPKCCDLGQIWDLGDTQTPFCGDITMLETQWEPIFYSDRYTKLGTPLQSGLTPHYVLHHPANGWCNTGHPFLISLKSIQEGQQAILFRVLQDGSIVTRVRRRQWYTLPKGDYCIDGIKKPVGSSLMSTNSSEIPETVVLYCHKEVVSSDASISKLYGIAMILSSLFLVATLAVFVVLREKYRKNVQRWTIFAYVAALFLMYIFFILSYFSNLFDGELVTSTSMCRFVGIGVHFTFIMSFCFLSCINFEIWFTVRQFASHFNILQGLHRMYLYSGFSLGLPCVIVTVGLILESIYDTNMDSDVITPEYGLLTCNIGSRDAFWVYMYGPVGLLLFSNLIFYISTAYLMWKIIKSVKEDSSVSIKHQKHRIRVTLTLFVALLVLFAVTQLGR